MQKPRRAVFSVSDKTGLEKFKALSDIGWESVSTGGTATELKKFGIPVIPVEEVTGVPEMMDGRLKTIHPKIVGGIIANRAIQKHMDEAAQYLIEMVDLVVVNFYGFHLRPGIENIDVGGPNMLRAAGKNGISVPAVVDPDDYDKVIGEFLNFGEVSEDTKEDLSIKVFEATSLFDIAVSNWMKKEKLAGHRFLRPVPLAH